MSTHEKLQNERDRIRQKITELEEIVKSNCGKITEDNMKTMRKYLEEQNAELRWEISELSHKLSLVEEQISHYPPLRKMVISKNILAYKKLLQSTDKNELRNVLFELVHHIVMDNENVSITFNFHRLLSGHEPILATVIEKRQNIAQLIHHRCQKLTFSELHIRI